MNGLEFVIGVVVCGLFAALALLDYFEAKRERKAHDDLRRALDYARRSRL